MFPEVGFAVSIYENMSIGAEFFTASATDLDTAREGNNRITFSLDGGNEVSSAAFTIHNTEGVVTLSTSIDREAAALHSMTVVASDDGGTRLSTTIPLLITVLDCNDNRPVFCLLRDSLCTPLARGDEYDRAILESSTVGTSVVTISATDADAGANAATRYRLEEDGGDSANFVIDAVSGVISISATLDTEATAVHNLTVFAIDLAFEVPVHVVITATDVNEHPPVFVASAIDVSVPEDTLVGTVIATFEASDADFTNVWLTCV